MDTEPGRMTVAEAGRKGGRRTSEKYGHKFYEEMGRKGGRTAATKHGHEHYVEIGRKGGAENSRINAAGRAALGLPSKGSGQEVRPL